MFRLGYADVAVDGFVGGNWRSADIWDDTGVGLSNCGMRPVNT